MPYIKQVARRNSGVKKYKKMQRKKSMQRMLLQGELPQRKLSQKVLLQRRLSERIPLPEKILPQIRLSQRKLFQAPKMNDIYSVYLQQEESDIDRAIEGLSRKFSL